MRIGTSTDTMIAALVAALDSNQTQHAKRQGTRANGKVSSATRGLRMRGAAALPAGSPPPLEVSRYDQLSPQERQRKQWRERQRRHREKVLREVKIPKRREMFARMRAGDSEAGRWWGHYEMSCISTRRMRMLGFPNLRKATANANAARELRKRQAEVEKWGNSL